MTNAQAVTATHDCKAPGCPNEARSSRGPYSYCDDCRKARGISSGLKPGNPSGDRRPEPDADSFEGRARAFVAAAKRLDKARAALDQARGELRDAVAAYNQAVRAAATIQTPTQEPS